MARFPGRRAIHVSQGTQTQLSPWDLRTPYQPRNGTPYGRFSGPCKDGEHSECGGECDCFCHDKDGA
jgi:hypothetical protein